MRQDYNKEYNQAILDKSVLQSQNCLVQNAYLKYPSHKPFQFPNQKYYFLNKFCFEQI